MPLPKTSKPPVILDYLTCRNLLPFSPLNSIHFGGRTCNTMVPLPAGGVPAYCPRCGAVAVK